MRKLPAILIACATAALLAGAASAAGRNSHVLNVPLPDGSVARVEYVGDVAPKVSVQRAQPIAFGDWAPLPAFAGFDRMFEEMNRQAEALLRQAQQMQQQATRLGANAAAPYVASFGDAPAGVTSTEVVSFSNGRGTCTRTTQSVSQGPGKPPKVTTSTSGDCGSDKPVPPASGPVSNT